MTVFGFKPPPVGRRPAPPSKGSNVPEEAEQNGRLACGVTERALSEHDFILVEVTPPQSSAEITTHDSTQVEGSGTATPTS